MVHLNVFFLDVPMAQSLEIWKATSRGAVFPHLAGKYYFSPINQFYHQRGGGAIVAQQNLIQAWNNFKDFDGTPSWLGPKPKKMGGGVIQTHLIHFYIIKKDDSSIGAVWKMEKKIEIKIKNILNSKTNDFICK